MTPPTVLLQSLSGARRRGRPFARAWPVALGSALATIENSTERREWAEVLGSMAGTWRGAFERRQPVRREQALTLLADDTDRVPVPDREAA